MVVIIFIATAISLTFGCGRSCCDPGFVVINEIMYAPQDGGPEWIELYNKSDRAIDLSGWTIEDADSTQPRVLSAFLILIESSGYICIAQDSSDLFFSFPNVSCPVLQPPKSWPRLNNNGDRIVIRDSAGHIIDNVEYEKQWGGGTGASLERIHPDWSSNNPMTWSTSVANYLATPCAPNSILASHRVQKAMVTVEPDPFDTKTTISYRLSAPTAIIKLEVYDIRGRLVRTLIDQEPSGSSGTVIWNGTDNNGKKLRMGVYIIYLEAIHAEGGILDRGKKTVTLAARLD